MYWNTVNELLKDTLLLLMNASEFSLFRLVGGTSLSLQVGHRVSVDIDLFSDAQYGTIDFENIENYLYGCVSISGLVLCTKITNFTTINRNSHESKHG